MPPCLNQQLSIKSILNTLIQVSLRPSYYSPDPRLPPTWSKILKSYSSDYTWSTNRQLGFKRWTNAIMNPSSALGENPNSICFPFAPCKTKVRDFVISTLSFDPAYLTTLSGPILGNHSVVSCLSCSALA